MKKIASIFLWISPLFLFGQFSVELDKDSIKIGEPINVQLKTVTDSNLRWPVFNDSIGDFEIISSKIDCVQNKENWLITQNYNITSWDSGTIIFPEISFLYDTSTEKEIYVKGVQLAEDAELIDIKEPLNAAISFSEILPYLIIFIFILLVIFLIRKYLTKKTNQIIEPKIELITVTPHEIALKKLEELKLKKLWENGKVKEFYSELSDILRVFIENELKTPAMEIPTRDIIERLNSLRVSTTELKTILDLSDLAKYAKAKPLDIENKESLVFAKNFILANKPSKQTENE